MSGRVKKTDRPDRTKEKRKARRAARNAGEATAKPRPTAQASHASSNAAIKKAREGEQAMEREREERMSEPGAEAIARKFHDAYERLAPKYGYETRQESAGSWEQVPVQNKRLMIAVVAELLAGGTIIDGALQPKTFGAHNT